MARRTNEKVVENQKIAVKKKEKQLDKTRVSDRKAIQKIKEETQEMLLPTLKEEMEKTCEFIVKTLKEKGEDKVNNIQIMSMISKRSLVEIARGGENTYSAQEIGVAFNMYLDMINRINEIKQVPPTEESFANFIGVSRTTLDSWRASEDKKEIMDYIHSYLTGVLATSSLTGETKEITSIYLQKVMGKVEQQAPTVVEYKKKTDINDIKSQIELLKRDNTIEADFTEAEIEEE